MDLGLKGKTAVVTGGSTGIGAAICDMLAGEGCRVLVNYYDNPEAAAEFAQGLTRRTGTKCAAAYGDISLRADAEALISEALGTLGGFDIMINCAALLTRSFIWDMTEEEWNRSTAVNYTGAFLLSKAAVKSFLQRNIGGSIIHIVSQSAFNGTSSGHVHYASAKAGVMGLVKSLSREVARFGIRVNAVAPGMVRTAMTEEKIAQKKDYYTSVIPCGRIAEPKDVAGSVVFLASDMASYLNGITIDASGGMK